MKKTIVIFLLLISTLLNATTYYIDPAGSNGNNGSIGSPWLTLAYACTQVTTAGDLIHVNVGTYDEGTNRMNLAVGVSIMGVGDASHIISSYLAPFSDYGSIFLSSPAQGTSGNQSISYIKLDGNNLTGRTGIAVQYRSDVAIHHCTIVDFKYQGISFAGGGNDGTEPTTYATGNECYNNNITNCTGELSKTYGYGLLRVIGQDGILIHNNTLTQTGRAKGDNSNIMRSTQTKNMKYYENISYKPQDDGAGYYNFHLEMFQSRGGNEIYNNEFWGGDCAMDLANVAEIGASTYSYWIHNNLIAYTELSVFGTGRDKQSICIETYDNGRVSDVIIEKNHFKNLPVIMKILSMGNNSLYDNIDIRYNIFENCGTTSLFHGYGILIGSSIGNGSIIRNVHIYNNAFQGALVNSGGTYYGAMMWFVNIPANIVTEIDRLYIKNNIFMNVWDDAYISIANCPAVLDSIEIQNNIVYNCPKSNEPSILGGKVITNYVNSGNIKSDPLWIGGSPFNFDIGSISPAVSAGLDVGLTSDILDSLIVGNPDMGAYEYYPPNPPEPSVVIISISGTWTKGTTATGNVISDGGGTVTDRGVCWGASVNPTTAGNHTHSGTGTGVYNIIIGGLVRNTIYYIRSFSVNEAGISYSDDYSFTTPPYSVLINGSSKIYYSGSRKVAVIK